MHNNAYRVDTDMLMHNTYAQCVDTLFFLYPLTDMLKEEEIQQK